MRDDNRDPKTVRMLKLLSTAATTAFELFVLAEISWYYLTDGEQTFHEAMGERITGLRERLDRRTAVNDTLENIRALPETDG